MKNDEKEFPKRRYGKNYKTKLSKIPWNFLEEGEEGYRYFFTFFYDIGSLVYLLHLPRGSRILDCGCGGSVSEFLDKMGYDVIGMDISEQMIESSKKRGCNAKFMVGDYEEPLPFKMKFDGIVSHDSLHHTENKLKVLKNLYDALRGDGILILFEPNWIHTWRNRKSEDTIDYKRTEKGEHQLQWVRLVKEAGFREVELYYSFRKPIKKNSLRGILNMLSRVLYQSFPLNFTTSIVLKCRK